MTGRRTTEWVILVNPAAGATPMPVERVEDAVARWGVAAVVEAMESAAALGESIAEVAASGRRPAVVGGNGTVNAAVTALVERRLDTTLAVLPGTVQSDLTRTFAIPGTIEEAAAHLRGDASYRIDVGVVDAPWGRRYFANDVQAGLGAAATRAAAALPRRFGSRRLAMGLALRLPGFARTAVHVEGERRLDGDALGIILANGQFLGGGCNVAPKALLVDGELDVQMITAAKRDVPSLASRMRRGMHLSSPDVHRRSMSGAVVTTERPWPVTLDGEPGGTTPFQASVIAGAVDLKI